MLGIYPDFETMASPVIKTREGVDRGNAKKAVTQRTCSSCFLHSSVCAEKRENKLSSETKKVAASTVLFLSPQTSTTICFSFTMGLFSESRCKRELVTLGKKENKCVSLLEDFLEHFP